MGKLWKKSDSNGNKELSKKVEAFTVGKDYILDQELIPYDVQASKVHAEALERIGILEGNEFEQLVNTLEEIRQLWEKAEFEISVEDEDGHTAIENYLVKQLGELGKKIHTGRSRNDQVLTALRLYERDRIEHIWKLAHDLARSFLNFAEEYSDIPMPGYTHTQRAMLSSVGLWAAAIGERLVMALEYVPPIYRNVNWCPLGTAAGYGVNFELPREFVADRLGFEGPIIGSMTAQHTRGRLEAEILSGLLPISDMLSQFSHDLIWYTSREFDFFEVADELCTGSSIMPQKKNLDSAEILRSRHAQLEGNITQLRQVTRNLTSGYHRDLQLTKEPVMKGLKNLEEMLEMGHLLITHITPKPDNLRKACTPEMFAADLANEKVKQGMPFREAYREIAENLDQLKDVDIDENLKSKKHLGATGDPGIDYIRERLFLLSL